MIWIFVVLFVVVGVGLVYRRRKQKADSWPGYPGAYARWIAADPHIKSIDDVEKERRARNAGYARGNSEVASRVLPYRSVGRR